SNIYGQAQIVSNFGTLHLGPGSPTTYIFIRLPEILRELHGVIKSVVCQCEHHPSTLGILRRHAGSELRRCLRRVSIFWSAEPAFEICLKSLSKRILVGVIILQRPFTVCDPKN